MKVFETASYMHHGVLGQYLDSEIAEAGQIKRSDFEMKKKPVFSIFIYCKQ
jgi:hypothetical protein